MIVTILATIAATGVTGWLYTTSRFWGVEWMEVLHGTGGRSVGLVGLHVAGVIFTSFRQGENLVAAMVHGRKPPTTRRHPEIVEHTNREKR